MENYYNKIYSTNQPTFGGGVPVPLVKKLLKYLPSGKVLELGAGEGRNSLFLAQNGFDARAIDSSSVGIDKLLRNAQQMGVSIRAEVGDITELEIEEKYDAVVCTFVFHHIKKSKAPQLLQYIKNVVREGGFVVITAFTKDGEFYAKDSSGEHFYPGHDELKELFSDFDIVSYDEWKSESFAKKPDGSPYINTAGALIAKKK